MGKKILLLLFLFLVSVNGEVFAGDYGFGKSSLVISRGSTWSSGQRSIVSRGKNVYLVAPSDQNIMFTKSIDGGKTFKVPVSITGCCALHPSIALGNGGIVYIVFSGTYIVKSIDDGESFSQPIYIGPGELVNVTVDDNGDVYVAADMSSADQPKFEIFKSTDGGATFTALNMNLTLPGYESDPVVSAKGGVLYITWLGPDGLYFTSSNDGGNTFSERVKVSGIETTNLRSHSLAIDNNSNISMSWIGQILVNGQSENKLFFAKSQNKGDTFEVKTIDSGMASTTWLQKTTIATDAAGNIYLGWDDASHAYFTMSDTDGATFKSSIRVTRGNPQGQKNPLRGLSPTIAANNAQDAVIAYTAHDGAYIAKSVHCTE